MDVINVLLEITVYSAILFTAIMIFRRINKGRISPVFSFALWFLLLLRLCIPVTFQSEVHFFTLPQAQPQVVAETGDSNISAMEQPELTIPPQTSEDGQTEEPLHPADMVQSIEPQPAKRAFTFTVYDILVIVWLTGVALMTAWTAYVTSKVKKTVKKYSLPASPEISPKIEKIYRACRDEMGIKKRPDLLITQNLASPALVASAKPKILLPYTFVKNAVDAEIGLAIRHELTHYKRMDHLVCILIRILTAVYWFNPVIWLTEKEIILDMETACDNTVVRGMKQSEKTAYANTILSMLTARAQEPFVLGMALSNSRHVAEKRIRGIYMKSKTKKGVKIAALLLVMIMLVACFTTACQPTQATQTEAALPQAEGILAPAETAEPTPVPEEERYLDSVQLSDAISVNYDATVLKPEGAIPVATMDFRDFTEADAQKVLDYFFADRELYKPWARTKAEVQEEIDALEQDNKDVIAKKDDFIAEHPWAETLYEYQEANGGGMSSDVSDPVMKEYGLTDEDMEAYSRACGPVQSTTGMNNYTIEKDKEELDTAPDIRQKEPAVIQYGDVNMGRVAGVESGHETLTDKDMIFNKLQVWSEGENGDISEVNSVRMDGGKRSAIYYSRKIYPSPYAGYDKRSLLTLPQDQAQKIAKDAVAAICPGMSLNGTTIAQHFDWKTQERTDAYDAYYIFTFTRSVSGVPITTDSYSASGSMDNDTEEVTYYEVIQALVDNDGILSFEWRAPYDNIQVTDADAQVLSMQEAMEAFEVNTLNGLEGQEYITEGTEDEYGFGLDSIEINIDKIQLGLSRVADGEGGFRLVPTWDFFGTAAAYKDGEEQKFNRFGQSQGNDSMGTVNALDGTEINRTGNTSTW